MKTYLIPVERKIWASVPVKANSLEEAIEKIKSGDYETFEYCDSYDVEDSEKIKGTMHGDSTEDIALYLRQFEGNIVKE